ncbi:MAG: hydantoinase B/oxoprolinase family protein [Alphaproteobacteria bacterium]|jgi:N-methylhydantoinase B|nr:hydantoinase B/oxoprolinase family protein [Alphaproteobacteria bacterium]MDP6590785.1 hydantoinase B/oxoprolinase family protein [Alphaproteobacteria bacterium]MDP6818674.1 hydantoinase B/oxoprolinase family protein [Alphaproteobacteria bacterium]
MPRISQITGTAFDGLNNPYVPPKELNISPSLTLHRDWDESVDAVTYEVIRHNLWNINEEHGATIQRISGSPVAMFALDLNPSILTEDAEFVYFGPYMQYMSGVTDTQVKWILEYRSDNPGIEAGDMFLANDPWVGAAHQMDVMLICPVFHAGELFCWITNCLHQYDIGGITPGSFCPSAESAFDEGILIPPVKIVENDVVRRDIEALYLRSSRKPEMVALDFRAQLAGNMTAKARIEQLIARYGANTVKSVMKKVIDNAEAAFLAKLKKIPDGVWRDRTYVEACRPGDRRTHRVQIALTKKGDKLTFDNEGTAPQDGAMNATYSGWRGSVMVAINELLSWDQYFAVGGALRHIEFDPVPGTLNCADFPASVSTAPTQSMEISLYPAYNIISKMLYSDAELRRDIMGIGGTSQWPTTIFRGIDQWGERYGYLLIDPIGGSIGAFAQGDGINTGGQARTPIGQLPNVEHNEQLFPLLFLYRKELPDSGGAGKFRGGLSAESCFIPHNTDHITQDTLSSGNAIPTSTGMMGGFPSTTNAYTFIRDSDILDRMGDSRLIEDASEVSGTAELLQLRQENFVQNAADVYAVRWSGGGGFGDPLRREPERIAHDLEHLNITPEAARDIFGAVLDADGQVDVAATLENRKQIRAARLERLGNGNAARESHEGEVSLAAGDNLAVYGSRWACAHCAADLGPLADNYKDVCLRDDRPVSHSNPLVGDPADFIDDAVAFRLFYCPACGSQIDNEIAVDSDPVMRDIELSL